jgi:hypothetical protein
MRRSREKSIIYRPLCFRVQVRELARENFATQEMPCFTSVQGMREQSCPRPPGIAGIAGIAGIERNKILPNMFIKNSCKFHGQEC